MQKSNFVYVFAFLFQLIFISQSAGQSTIYARSFGSSSSEFTGGQWVDNMGNAYIGITFSGTIDLNPGAGVASFTSNGSFDLAVVKLDPSGNYVWGKAFGGTGVDFLQQVKMDGSGNVLICGNFSSTVDFDPGAGTFNITSAGQADAFVLKLDPNGNFIWAKAMGGIGSDAFYGLDCGPGNTYYLSGTFAGSVTFPTVPATTVNSAGNLDIWVMKLNVSGDPVWVKQMGGTGSDHASSIALDGNGSLFVGGQFTLTADMDPSAGISNFTSLGQGDIYVTKMDTAGTWAWTKSVGSNSYDYCYSLAVRNNGNILLAGSFSGPLDMDPNSGVQMVTGNPGASGLVLELSDLGNFEWGTDFQSNISCEAVALSFDQYGNLYMGVDFQGNIDAQPGSGVTNLVSAGNYDSFVLKLTPAMQFVWARQVMGAGSNGTGDLSVDGAGNVFFSGGFSGNMDGDVFAPYVSLSSNNNSPDVYALKFSQCPAVAASQNLSGCGSVPINGITYYTSGIYQQVLVSQGGCDSVLTLNVTVNPITSSTQAQTVCGSYTWPANGQTYSSSGAYTAFLTSSAGCDSTITLTLTVNQATSGSEAQTACDSYTWPTNGQTYAASGAYTALLTNSLGCDSTATLNLNITVVDTAVAQVGAQLQAQAGAAQFQWLDCENGFIAIPGAQSANFTPSLNGTYAVAVTQNGCIDTSGCHTVMVVGISQPSLGAPRLDIYPNPVRDWVHVQLAMDAWEPVRVELWDAMGRCHLADLWDADEAGKLHSLHLQALPSGTYWLRVEGASFQAYRMVQVIQ